VFALAGDIRHSPYTGLHLQCSSFTQGKAPKLAVAVAFSQPIQRSSSTCSHIPHEASMGVRCVVPASRPQQQRQQLQIADRTCEHCVLEKRVMHMSAFVFCSQILWPRGRYPTATVGLMLGSKLAKDLHDVRHSSGVQGSTKARQGQSRTPM